ncbi:MAG: TetR/AcrR family transcriptional regulator [Candidatus Obscuribacterales bacterium]|nr:TetR/AcrR family transcriptional regulator [Candidatus Obscuribacterales bacterium]
MKSDTRSEDSRSNSKRDAILRSAMNEFFANGYEAASMDRIADAANVSKRTVYNHFEDKEKLYKSLIEFLANQRQHPSLNDVEKFAAVAPPKNLLQMIGMSMIQTIKHESNILPFIRIIIGESGRFPELAKTFVRSMEKPKMEFLISYLKNNKFAKFSDPEATAWSFSGTIVYYVIITEILGSSEIMSIEPERLITSLVDSIVAGAEKIG